jgi:hypothetical protein
MAWDGEVLRPLPRFAKIADVHYVVGDVHLVAEIEERSEKAHRHEFAWLREAWLSLPENLADLYPSTEHLRKRALIDAGFYDEQVIDCGSQAAALRVASFARGEDDFALVITRGPLVVVRKAKSQSRRAMRPDEFQRSKTALMETVAAMIGVKTDALQRQTEAA